jgi:hypothetical protein
MWTLQGMGDLSTIGGSKFIVATLPLVHEYLNLAAGDLPSPRARSRRLARVSRVQLFDGAKG